MKCLEKKYSVKEILESICEILFMVFFPIFIVWIIYTQPLNTKELLEPIKSIVNFNLMLKSFSTFFLACIVGMLFVIGYNLEKILKLLKEKK